MTIVTFGMNHVSAPIALREQFAFSDTHTAELLNELCSQPAVNEAVIVSTCNRTELYSDLDSIKPLQHWLRQSHLFNYNEVIRSGYHYRGIHAVRHLMRVTSGLDSMVLGEPQIFGQVKSAYQSACEHGTVGKQLGSLFPAVFATCKQVREQTDIGKNAVSIAYVTCQLAQRIFSRLSDCKVLLIGAGETIELVATHLQNFNVKQLTVANRTHAQAEQLARAFNGTGIRIGDIPQYLSEMDIVISATASQLPILGKGLLEKISKQRKHRPLFMADLAVPRDVEPEVGQLEDVYLYNIDDMQRIIQQNLHNRHEAAKQAQSIIDMQAQHYMRMQRVNDVAYLIQQYRNEAETIRDRELIKALDQLNQGKAPDEILKQLASSLTNKLIHQPTVKMRQAAYDRDSDMLMSAKYFFDL